MPLEGVRGQGSVCERAQAVRFHTTLAEMTRGVDFIQPGPSLTEDSAGTRVCCVSNARERARMLFTAVIAFNRAS